MLESPPAQPPTKAPVAGPEPMLRLPVLQLPVLRLGALLMLPTLLIVLSCGPRVVLDPIASVPDEYTVALRRTVQGDSALPRGYQHPATISDVRLAHILANLEFENSEGDRQPIIRSIRVYPLAEALNQATQKAGPSDEIVAVVYGTDRRLGLFTSRKVTSFRLFFDEQFLNFEFYDIERELERGDGKPGRNDDYRIPESTPEVTASFKVLAGEAHYATSRRALQVEWRNPYFAQPVSLSVRGNRFKRRQVLMEETPELPSAAELDPESSGEALSPAVRDAQIRALDQLDGLRRQGLIKEAEFQRRRRLILEGNLEEAGYPAPSE